MTWGDPMRLPLPDVQSVVVTYLDDNGDEQTLPSSDYELLEGALGSYITFRDAFTYPSLDDDVSFPIVVMMTAGYGGPGDVPDALKMAIKMLGSHWYEARSAASTTAMYDVPFGVDMLIAPYRRSLG